MVKAGEVVLVNKMPIVYSYHILDPFEKRVGAKIVDIYVKNITPEEEGVLISGGTE